MLGYASADNSMLGSVAPVIEVEGQALNALDKLIRGLRLLARYNEYFQHSHTASHWATSSSELLAFLSQAKQQNSNEAAALKDCQAAIADLLEQCEQAELEALIAPEIIRDYFKSALGESDASQNFLSGGVTVCRMVPMRQIPFKVICLHGMNEAEMPRTEPPGFIQRLAEEIKSTDTRRYGDRSLRDDDRFLFLQLLSAADTTFYISYCGKHPRDDTEQAPSSLLSELLDCLAAMHPEQKNFRESFVLQHALQVFSGDEKPDPRRLRFDPAWQVKKADIEDDRARFLQAPLENDAPDASEHIVQWQDFKRFFKHPAKYFLQTRLGLRLVQQAEQLAEHEPFSNPSGLPRYHLRQAVFNALITDEQAPSNAELLEELRSRALLPSGFAAELILQKTLSEVRQQAARFKAWREGEPSELPFELILESKRSRFVLQGNLADVYPLGAARIVLGEMRGKHHCSHGLDALLLSALNSEKPVVEFVEIKKDRPQQRTRSAHDFAMAKAHLAELMELFVLGQQQPLPFAPDAGFTYIKNLRDRSAIFDERAWQKAAEASSSHDLWWATALRGQEPFTDHQDQPESFPSSVAFREISLKVFSACAPEFIASGADTDKGDSDE